MRLATLTLAAAIGLTAAPSRGADGTLGRDRPAVPLTDAEHWALRPTRVAPTAAVRPDKVIRLSDLPEERRRVRVVYQGYAQSTPLGTAR